MDLELKHISQDNWSAIARIYEHGMKTDTATFEIVVPSWEHWHQSHLAPCRIAAWHMSKIVGWAALSRVSNRTVYRGVAEVSLYVDTNYTKNGIGTQLLTNLIKESEKEGIWTLQAAIFRENEASLRLHKKVGFREIGYRERIGKRNGVWYDNLLLERRSKTIGIN